jgi:Chromate transport protein ChrA
MNLGSLFSLLWVFSLLSIMAVGGGTSVLPAMKDFTVEIQGWVNESQFRDIYALGQIVPGPNMLMVIVIGYHVAAIPGAIVAFLGFFVPSSVIALATGRVWNHFEGSPWRTAIQRAFAPIVVGLMLAGTISIARTAIVGDNDHLQICLALAAIVFVILYFGRKINPALLILAGGVAGWFFLR